MSCTFWVPLFQQLLQGRLLDFSTVRDNCIILNLQTSAKHAIPALKIYLASLHWTCWPLSMASSFIFFSRVWLKVGHSFVEFLSSLEQSYVAKEVLNSSNKIFSSP